MKNYKLTIVGAAVALLIYLGSAAFQLELFELLIEFLDELEHLEVDELIIPLVIFVGFMVADSRRRNKANRINREKMKIYQAMVQSTHHVLNNLLNQMLFVKMKAEDTPGFDPEVINIYEEIVDEAQSQIHALSNVASVSEESIHESVRPKS